MAEEKHQLHLVPCVTHLQVLAPLAAGAETQHTAQ